MILKKIKTLAVAVFCVAGLSSCNYNSLVEKQQGVDQQWAEVENQYQRRADLIPNLVSTVKGDASHEEGTLTKVTEARSKATQITINPEDLNEENLARFQAAQNELSGALKSLLAVTEAYPDLKANENFLELQRQLEETENKISYARKFYNDTALQMNNTVDMFPSNIIAGLFKFNKVEFFKAQEAERENVKVEF